MKRIIMLVMILLCMNSIFVYATETNNTDSILDEVKQTLIYRVSTNGLYSKWGWSQRDVVSQHLANNMGFKKELNVSSALNAATVDNVSYGNIIGVCEIDFKRLDNYIIDNTLQDNLDKVIKILDEWYIEMKYNDITLSYMNINEDERISHFIEPGILKSVYIKNLLPKETYIKPTMYLIKENEYIKGIYANSNDENSIIMYEDFNNSDNNEQFYSKDTITALIEADEKYIIDNPRIDYELIEKQKAQEIQQLIEEGKQRDVMVYSITAFLGVALVISIFVFVRVLKKD